MGTFLIMQSVVGSILFSVVLWYGFFLFLTF